MFWRFSSVVLNRSRTFPPSETISHGRPASKNTTETDPRALISVRDDPHSACRINGSGVNLDDGSTVDGKMIGSWSLMRADRTRRGVWQRQSPGTRCGPEIARETVPPRPARLTRLGFLDRRTKTGRWRPKAPGLAHSSRRGRDRRERGNPFSVRVRGGNTTRNTICYVVSRV